MNQPLFDEKFLQKLERLAMLSRRAAAGSTQGERRSRKLGQSVEFSDFRPYVAGDDFRRIDWNAYARMERFFLKLFVEEEDLTVHFLLDASYSMRWGEPSKLWYAARAAGALGYIALSGLDRVTMTVLDGQLLTASETYFSPHRGKQQALAWFNFLQNLVKLEAAPAPLLQPSGTNIERTLRAYAANTTQKGILILLSDLMEDAWLDGLRALASRGFEMTVLHILSPDEVSPEMEGEFKLLDSEGLEALEITADYETLEQYRQKVRGWQEDIHQFCSARQIHHVPLQTTMALDDLLFNWMRVLGVLQ